MYHSKIRKFSVYWKFCHFKHDYTHVNYSVHAADLINDIFPQIFQYLAREGDFFVVVGQKIQYSKHGITCIYNRYVYIERVSVIKHLDDTF